MSNAAAPPPPSGPPKVEEIPLEDIDKILAEEDPEFAKSLEEVRSVEADRSVTIEASVEDESLLSGESSVESKSPEKGLRKYIARFKGWLFTKRMNFKNQLRSFFKNFSKNALIWLKTKPKEYALYSIVMLKIASKKIMGPIAAFRDADRWQKLAVLVLTGLIVACGWVLLHNFKGIWIPQLSEPILRGFSDKADWVETYNPKEGGESFYSAFPQERHEFLFSKMKVNLRRTVDNPLPMGAFELIVLLDSKDTAIEVRDREVEFNDMLQRVFEEESFNDLATELGKAKLKARLKREMNQKLTQGWVKDINFKTFILKP